MTWPDAIEIDRVVPASGNMTIGPQQFCWCPSGQTAPGRPAPGPLAATSCVEVQRLVNATGIITLGNQAIQVGFPHAGKIVTIQLGDTSLRIIDQHGELITAVPRNGTGEISRFKAYGSKKPR